MIIVPLKEGENIEKALKKFKRKFEKTGVVKELRNRQAFEKPSVTKRKQMMQALNGKFIAVEDLSLPGVYDALVVLNDTAKITKDGAVVGGNKIKIGLPITLEGQDYRFSGTVSDLKVVHLTEDEGLNKAINSTGNDVQ